ncbi:hypothetical protein HZS_5079 [Henneguya salminicola]|nr:hypothetical protein HZS_5079 [Henneguya salminicola]
MREQIERKKLVVYKTHLYRIGRENIRNNYISSRCLTKICPRPMRTNRDGNLILNNATVHNHAANPEELFLMLELEQEPLPNIHED